MHADESITIAELYPEFTKGELEEAEARVRRYLAVLLRMSERLASEGRSINDLVDCPFADPGDPMYHPHRQEVETDPNPLIISSPTT